MRLLRITLGVSALFFSGAVAGHVPHGHDDSGTVHAARCTPYAQGTCRACKNCRYCRHCAENGGSCSVCR